MKLPPLASLRAFEAAARRGGFLHAASELGMSAAAVSQHVRSLETWLGLALFERRARGVELTQAGREFGAACTQGLGQIALAAERLTARGRQKVVSLACQPSIVSHWLAPRLPRFRAAHPDIQVSIVYPLGAKTPEEAGVDLLIRHGTRPDRPAQPILSAATRPTCSPAYLERSGPIRSPADLLRAELLHDETEAAWPAWFALQGIAAPAHAGPIFADFNLLVSSAIAGLGVGLCPTALIEDELRRGSLVTLFDPAADTDKYYWLLESQRSTEAAALMRTWLITEAAAQAAPGEF
ncbi:LysR substrate-binding domain-containing protein [Rhizobiaceae bacterium n13]|uniref:LysR substrate-binding domain-containing protein n=1 Tax=Ferirhizobium litorale TaxID=2927786 RepID=A0AAE3QGK6_9HYPH|nr:LysR substrate-binding domain-containing protein [Fererhizobium litorale]MDI7864855.1 LysR substrate-binding domain-containing protein [Fererhizobium litorale]MDI7923135.1 LysR substrate-binding domain-containing protein [Fererhizobium litorale]